MELLPLWPSLLAGVPPAGSKLPARKAGASSRTPHGCDFDATLGGAAGHRAFYVVKSELQYTAMTIELKPEHQRLIDRAIQSGAYQYPEEVISAALDMLAEDLQVANVQPRRSRLWELREGLSLGDISIRELIEEGRE